MKQTSTTTSGSISPASRASWTRWAGITLYNDIAFSTSKYDYPLGVNTLDGDEALQFARERYSFVDGDIQRGKNQMRSSPRSSIRRCRRRF